MTIISRKGELASDIYNQHDGLHVHSEVIIPELGYGGYVPAWRCYPNFTEILNAKTLAVSPTSATYEKDGNRHTISCDSVVVTGGYQKRLDEALAYAGSAPEFYLAGDVESDSNDLQRGNVSAYGKVLLL